MDKIYLYGFGFTDEQKNLVNNIVLYLDKLLKEQIKDKEFDVIRHDLKVFDCEKDSIGIAFGNKVSPYIIEPKLIKQTVCLTSIDENKKTVKEDLKAFVSDLKNLYNTNRVIEKDHSSYVEVNENITAGIEGAVFNFTLEEAEHLKKIKDLLGGGKIVFIKGDSRLEIH
jgi:inorganic pyrophosphatase/exopolyphosphatase